MAAEQTKREGKFLILFSILNFNRSTSARLLLPHLLPKSLFGEHYTDNRNIVIMCREHHNLYDNSLEFRQQQTELFKKACEINEKDARKYFRL